MISIIVPVYNVEEYLDRCVASLVGQTYADLEIILVDDGSTDSSAELCRKWAAVDERIVFATKQNGGLSDARNYGATMAKGDYLGFVDSDDFVDARMFEMLLSDLLSTGADMATCDVKNVYDEPSDAIAEIGKDAIALDAETALKRMARSELPRIWVPTRLYPRSIFSDGFLFPLGRTYEDAYTIVELMSLVDSVSVNESKLYFYCHHDQTITTAGYSAKTHDMIEAWEHGRELAAQRFPALNDDFAFRCLWARCVVLDKMIVNGSMDGSAEEAELVAYIKEHYASVSNHPSLTAQRKRMCKLLSFSLPLYRIAVRAWRSKNKSYI